MVDDRGVVREISWRDMCPWLLLTRTFSLATSIQMLLAALIAVSVVPLGWRLAGEVFLPKSHLDQYVQLGLGGHRAQQVFNTRLYFEMLPGERISFNAAPPERSGSDQATALLQPEHALPPAPQAAPIIDGLWPVERGHLTNLTHAPFFSDTPPPDSPLFGVFARLLAPFRALFVEGLQLRELMYYLCGALWTLLIWAIPGAIITRAAALMWAREEPLDWDRGLWFAATKFLSYVGAPLVPLIGAFALAALVMGAGLLLRIPVAGPIGVGLFWFLAVLVSLVIGLILLGVALGWPLMWGTLAVEGSDLFDAMSRAYAYTYQRPYHYLFYAFVLAVLGFLGWLLVWQFSEGMIGVLDWAVRWGYSDQHWNALMAPNEEQLKAMNPGTHFGAGMIVFWSSTIRAVAMAFSYSFFWCGAVGLYFLLRRDVDQMEIDEIWSEPSDELLGLPKLKPHPAAAPSPAPADTPAPPGEPLPPST